MKPFLSALALACAALTASGARSADAPAGSMGGALLSLPTGVRAAGMGEAFSAVAEDAEAVTWNPAGLGLGSDTAFLLAHLVGPAGFRFEELTARFAIAGGGLGVSGGALLVPAVAITDADGVASGASASASEIVGRVGYGRAITQTLCVGLGVSFLSEKIASTSVAAPSGSVGLLWSASDSLRFAVTASNLGGGAAGFSLPTTAGAGLSYQIVPGTLLAALDARFVVNGGPHVSAGLEWRAIPDLSMRAGFSGGSPASDLGGIAALRAGLGYRIRLGDQGLTIEYALVHAGLLGLDHRVGLSLRKLPPTEARKPPVSSHGGPAAPGRVTVQPQTGSLLVKWDAVESATGYHIYAAEPGGSPRRLTSKPWEKSEITIKGGDTKTIALTVASVSKDGLEGPASASVAYSGAPGAAARGARTIAMPPTPTPTPETEIAFVESPTPAPRTGGGADAGVAAKLTAIAEMLDNIPSGAGATPTPARARKTDEPDIVATAAALLSEPIPAEKTATAVAKSAAKPTVAPTSAPTHAPAAAPAGKFGAPESVRARYEGKSSYLEWDAVPGATGYHVYLNTALPGAVRANYMKITFKPVAKSPYLIPADAPGTFQYLVTALDAGGKESERSRPVSVKITQ